MDGLKNTIFGVIVLGVISSLIGQFIWENRRNKSLIHLIHDVRAEQIRAGPQSRSAPSVTQPKAADSDHLQTSDRPNGSDASSPSQPIRAKTQLDRQFKGTAEEFAASFPVFLERAAAARGLYPSDFQRETEFIIGAVRTCAQITPQMALNVTTPYGQEDLSKLGKQFDVCHFGYRGVSSEVNPSFKNQVDNGIVLVINSIGNWRDGRGFSVEVLFSGLIGENYSLSSLFNSHGIVYAVINGSQ